MYFKEFLVSHFDFVCFVSFFYLKCSQRVVSFWRIPLICVEYVHTYMQTHTPKITEDTTMYHLIYLLQHKSMDYKIWLLLF